MSGSKYIMELFERGDIEALAAIEEFLERSGSTGKTCIICKSPITNTRDFCVRCGLNGNVDKYYAEKRKK